MAILTKFVKKNMAISAINIIQDNIISGSNLLPTHNTLVFIAEATYSGVVPDLLYVGIYDITDNLLFAAKCIPYQDPSITTRTFLFDSAQFIRAQMNSFEDVLQLNNTFLLQENPTKQLKIAFLDPVSGLLSTSLTIDALHGASQFGDYPNKVDIYNNTPQTYYCKVDGFVYVYFYNTEAGAAFVLYKNGVEQLNGFLNEIGYYRYKTEFSVSGNVGVDSDAGVGISVIHNITVVGCDNDALLKYLDKNGQNRYFTFNEFYETRDNSQSVGSVQKLVTDIRTDQSNKSQIGKRTRRSISLITELENEQLQLAAELVQSPRVYLYAGTLPSDVPSDWLQVEVLTNDSLIRRRIGTSGIFNLSIQLPDINNITAL